MDLYFCQTSHGIVHWFKINQLGVHRYELI
jgi:hypothetical protein